MGREKDNSRGFTLIASVLILVLLSGVAVGLLFMVSSQYKMSGNDLEANLAYYGAQSGMEKLNADLAALYQSTQNPSSAQIQALASSPPTASMVGSMTYTESITYNTTAGGSPVSTFSTIPSGDEQGLYALTIPMTLNVIATRPSGASANLTRLVEVALIPVFQYGVFCTFDCAFMPGPNYSFGGRVHANGNVFMGGESDMVFGDKISAGKRIIREYFENGYAASSGLTGNTYVPKAAGGCPMHTFTGLSSYTNCVELSGVTTVPGDASWSGGIPPAGTANTNFPSLSAGTFNGYLSDTTTGAGDIEMSFVQNNCNQNPPPCTDPISIIRKPLAGEGPSGALPQARMYNKAQIRILLADTQADLHPERGPLSDGQDIQFYSTGNTSYTVPLTSGTGTEYLGVATVSSNAWVAPYLSTGASGWTTYPLLGEVTTSGLPANGQGAWIRVEYLNNSGTWVGVTTEWLGLGFGRQFNTQLTAPYGSSSGTTNTINPQAILLLHELRPGLAASSATGASSTGSWYPINFYDTREGEMRDTSQAAESCSVNGIMNAVELDVGNLALWLKGTTGSSGVNVNYTNYNGYILYFSDHRGSITDPNVSNGGQTPAGVISGESGLEDVVNSSSATGLPPNGTLEPASYYSFSPEDVDMNGKLDNWGEVNIGYGFGVNTNTSPLNSYVRVSNCGSTASPASTSSPGVGVANAVTGARHVLKLVDGGMSSSAVSYLPMMPSSSGCSFTSSGSGCGGFTVASENPVYVQGNYNSSQYDPWWSTMTSATPSNNTPHAAASIVADSITILSNSWSDFNSLVYPTAMGSRTATTTYYRFAVAAGSNIAFPLSGTAISITNGGWTIGTDGGEIEFLHYLEEWSGQTINYLGSIANLWHSEYNTGTYKCCTTVYDPGTRNYDFDVLFLNPANLPPGTPMLQDIDNLSYHQNFTPQ